jgi:hypothetical protein
VDIASGRSACQAARPRVLLCGVAMELCAVLMLLATTMMATAAYPPQHPRPFPHPRLLELSPPGQTRPLLLRRRCGGGGGGFVLSRAAGGEISYLDTTPTDGGHNPWPLPPEAAFQIYRPLILRHHHHAGSDDDCVDGVSNGVAGLSVHLNGSSVRSSSSSVPASATAPTLPLLPPGSSPEAYALDLGGSDDMARLVVSSYVGLLRGLQTFSQLVSTVHDGVDGEELHVPAFIRVR